MVRDGFAVLKVELSEAMWTIVMDQLAEGSIRKCLPAMQAIGQQLAAQQQAQKPLETERADSNG